MSTGGEGFYEKMRGERWREEKPRANRDKSATYDGEQQKRRGERRRREKGMLSSMCTSIKSIF